MKIKKLIPLIIILILAFVISIGIGAVSISPTNTTKILLMPYFSGIERTWPESHETIILNFRLPRIILSILIGMSLSTAGVAYQALFNNPMADPFIIGASAGAALGATMAIFFSILFTVGFLSSITIFAFIGSIGAILVSYSISRVGGKVPVTTLLLSGIAVSSFCSAVVSIMTYLSGHKLGQIIFWIMGSLSGRSWPHVYSVFPYFILAMGIMFFNSRELNLLVLGEETAQYLGVSVEKVKIILLGAATLVTAAAVSVAGIIGFVGLIVPHITRFIVGPDHRTLVPAAAIIGGIFMLTADTVARSLISQEIPVGIITSLCGAPFFVYLLKTKTGLKG